MGNITCYNILFHYPVALVNDLICRGSAEGGNSLGLKGSDDGV
jgi:hypothetical protein